nr:hypothetical protein [Salinispora arenicola]
MPSLVFHPDTGQPLAVIDAAAVTSLRTAAASAVATDVLARVDAGDLALLGAGVQARSHLVAMNQIRTLRRVRVWNRTPAHAEQFRAWARPLVEVDVELTLDAGRCAARHRPGMHHAGLQRSGGLRS